MAMSIEERRARGRERARVRRAERRALGIKDNRVRVRTEEQKRQAAANNRRYREEAHARGELIASDTWHLRNPEKHRARTAAWRQRNPEKSRGYSLKWRTANKERYLQVSREASARRRATFHGRLNNLIVACAHRGVLAKINRASKYTTALGYSWRQLRQHLEAQFLADMNWDNWGEVWEVDHIRPLASFRYESLDDPQFREAWKLSNLRPFHRDANARKGCTINGV